MSKTESEKQKPADEPKVTADLVQRMIDASLVRLEMSHGHLSPDDAAARLAELEGDQTT